MLRFVWSAYPVWKYRRDVTLCNYYETYLSAPKRYYFRERFFLFTLQKFYMTGQKQGKVQFYKKTEKSKKLGASRLPPGVAVEFKVSQMGSITIATCARAGRDLQSAPQVARGIKSPNKDTCSRKFWWLIGESFIVKIRLENVATEFPTLKIYTWIYESQKWKGHCSLLRVSTCCCKYRLLYLWCSSEVSKWVPTLWKRIGFVFFYFYFLKKISYEWFINV